MKALSLGNLIDESAFCKAIKKSESLHWTVTEDGRDIVVNGHWIIDAHFSNKARSALVAIFGRVPEPGAWYIARPRGRGYDVGETSPLPYEKFFEDVGSYTAVNRHLTYELADGRTVAIYNVFTGEENVQIYLASPYADMINTREYGVTNGKPYSGIMFHDEANYYERAFILPVRVTENPFAFLG